MDKVAPEVKEELVLEVVMVEMVDLVGTVEMEEMVTKTVMVVFLIRKIKIY